MARAFRWYVCSRPAGEQNARVHCGVRQNAPESGNASPRYCIGAQPDNNSGCDLYLFQKTWIEDCTPFRDEVTATGLLSTPKDWNQCIDGRSGFCCGAVKCKRTRQKPAANEMRRDSSKMTCEVPSRALAR